VLVGIKSNEHRMQSLGYVTFRYKLAAFALAGGLGGVAGFLYAVVFGFVTPELMSWHQSGNVLLMVILGGMGNLVGRWPGPSPSSRCRRCSRCGPSTGSSPWAC
jgi:branched-chain amino acid transport system permease protein